MKTVDDKASVLQLLSDALLNYDNVIGFYELNHNIPVCQLLYSPLQRLVLRIQIIIRF